MKEVYNTLTKSMHTQSISTGTFAVRHPSDQFQHSREAANLLVSGGVRQCPLGCNSDLGEQVTTIRSRPQGMQTVFKDTYTREGFVDWHCNCYCLLHPSLEGARRLSIGTHIGTVKPGHFDAGD